MNLSQETLNKFRYACAKKFNDIDPYNKVIGFDDLPGDMASPEFTVLFSGPPTVAIAKKTMGDSLTPIGLAQNISYNGSQSITPVPECGSKFVRYVPGRTIHSASIGRLLARQGSVLYSCYAWLEKFLDQGESLDLFLPPGDDGELPGAVGRHWMTLESDLFKLPTGFLLITGNQNGEVLSRVYWERCLLAEHAFQSAAESPTILEQVSIKMSRAVPMHGANLNLGGRPNGTLTSTSALDSNLA